MKIREKLRDWVTTMPLGKPVLPEENGMIAMSSSGASTAAASAISSSAIALSQSTSLNWQEALQPLRNSA
nr:hypothetical protein [uncultured Pseudomonas sp.]